MIYLIYLIYLSDLWKFSLMLPVPGTKAYLGVKYFREKILQGIGALAVFGVYVLRMLGVVAMFRSFVAVDAPCA